MASARSWRASSFTRLRSHVCSRTRRCARCVFFPFESAARQAKALESSQRPTGPEPSTPSRRRSDQGDVAFTGAYWVRFAKITASELRPLRTAPNRPDARPLPRNGFVSPKSLRPLRPIRTAPTSADPRETGWFRRNYCARLQPLHSTGRPPSPAKRVRFAKICAPRLRPLRTDPTPAVPRETGSFQPNLRAQLRRSEPARPDPTPADSDETGSFRQNLRAQLPPLRTDPTPALSCETGSFRQNHCAAISRFVVRSRRTQHSLNKALRIVDARPHPTEALRHVALVRSWRFFANPNGDAHRINRSLASVTRRLRRRRPDQHTPLMPITRRLEAGFPRVLRGLIYKPLPAALALLCHEIVMGRRRDDVRHGACGVPQDQAS